MVFVPPKVAAIVDANMPLSLCLSRRNRETRKKHHRRQRNTDLSNKFHDISPPEINIC
jgi:hypothetical protein